VQEPTPEQPGDGVQMEDPPAALVEPQLGATFRDSLIRRLP